MPHCLDSPQPVKIVVEQFNGAKWEESMAKNPKLAKKFHV